MLLALMYGATVLVGLACSGFVSSGWALATGQAPRYYLFGDRSLRYYCGAMLGLVTAPLQLLQAAVRGLNHTPLKSLAYACIGLLWGFAQGVVILTQIFGVQ